MKKYFNKAVAVLLCISLLSGCGAANESFVSEAATGASEVVTEASAATVSNEVTETTEAEADKQLSEEERLHLEMIQRSLISVGNTERIHKAIEKARNGEEVTIAYLGGSITQGAGANPEKENCYAALSARLFTEKFAADADKVNYVNAGIAGTPSLLGITRCNNDIISKQPDVVFVEFAVNDGTDATSREVYESLVRKLLNSESAPAVVLIFTVLSSGYSAQENMQMTGEHYDLGMISVREAITPEVEAGRMEFIGGYAVDEAHPSNFGHDLIAQLIGYYLDEADKTESTPYTMPEEPQFKASFEALENITDSSEYITSAGDFSFGSLNCFTYSEGWQRKGDEANAPMVLELECSKMTIAYKQVNSQSSGAVDVYVDGEKATTLYGYSKNGWGNVITEIVISSDEIAMHKVELKMADGDETKAFTLLGIGYVK